MHLFGIMMFFCYLCSVIAGRNP